MGDVAVQSEIHGLAVEEPCDVSVEVISSETIPLTELTYGGKTFVFSRPLFVRVIEEEGGWALESDTPEFMGFGHSRDEAELSFCSCFASYWEDIACEDDSALTLGARKVKREFLALVKALK